MRPVKKPPVDTPTTPKPSTPKPTTSFAVGDKVVPTKKVDYDGRKLWQWDKSYIITSINGNRAALKAKRGKKLVTWAAMNVKNIKKV